MTDTTNMIEVPFGASFGETAAERQDRMGVRPLLDQLPPAQRKRARARIRCEYDRSVLAVVMDGCIVTTVDRYARSVHDNEILLGCFECSVTASGLGRDGHRVRRWQRDASTRAIWRLVDRRRRDISLKDVLTPGSLVDWGSGS